MTKEEKLEAFSMLLDGYTLQAVGDKFGVSKQRVKQVFTVVGIKNDTAAESCVYPNISRWLSENGYGYRRVAKLCDTTDATVISALKDGRDCKKSFIDKFLEVSGMTYEKAFGEKREIQEASE